MPRERTLTAAAIVVVVVALLVAAVVPNVLADPTDEGPARPGHVGIADVSISPGQVGGETAVLQVQTRLRHEGNPTKNVSVEVRAVDSESGFLATTESVDVGTLSADGEVPVTTNLSVEREGGYRIEVVVYRDDQRIDEGGKSVSGLDALTPEYARTSVGFSDSDVLPALSFSVAEADDDRATLDVSASLTNRGDAPSEDLRVTLIFRQADSNIVAAREDVAVGTIRPGRTESVSTAVTVPSAYNYYIDAILWKDGVMVDTARSAANLDPTKTLNVNQTETEVNLRVSDFESDSGAPRPTEAATHTETSAPGFGVAAALGGLALTALLARRRWSR